LDSTIWLRPIMNPLPTGTWMAPFARPRKRLTTQIPRCR
jgi:hypothetical protein